MIGAILVWFGWFGFNTGSALTFDAIVMSAFVNTTLASTAGIAGWGIVERFVRGKVSLVGTLSGMLGRFSGDYAGSRVRKLFWGTYLGACGWCGLLL